MRIVYFGTSTFAQPALQALVNEGYTVAAVVTQPDRPAGRGGKMTPPPVKILAQELHLPVLQPESCRTPEFLETLRAYAPDLLVVAAYGQFLPDALLTLPPKGAVNLHGSLLPKLRGAAPIQRSIWNGDEITGVCLMWMVRAMDAGDVISCAEVPILPDDNAGTLTEKLAQRAAELLITWLPALRSGSAPHLPQDPAEVTLAPVIQKEERVIDWAQPAVAIWRQIRALAPAPAATSLFHGAPVKILAARPSEEAPIPQAAPGEIIGANRLNGLRVATGDGVLQILTLQPAGKRAMSADEFIRGAHIALGERFGE